MKTPLFTLALTLLITVSAWAGKPGWTSDYDKALQNAGNSKKYVLLDFTGSDWCPYCVQMDKEVFSKAPFKSFAKENLVLVELDFPREHKIAAMTLAQNAKLGQQFNVNGFPTSILLDSSGHEVARWEGFNKDLVSQLKDKVNK